MFIYIIMKLGKINNKKHLAFILDVKNNKKLPLQTKHVRIYNHPTLLGHIYARLKVEKICFYYL